MGFLKSITKPFTNVVKSVATIVKNPVKAVTSGTLTNVLLTGGVNLAVPSLNKTLSKATSYLTNPQLALPIATGVLTGNPALALSALSPSTSYGGKAMGFNLGGFLGGVGSALGGISNPYISGVGQIATAFSPAFSQPVYGPTQPSYPQPQGQPVMSTMPVIASGASAIARLVAPILFRISSKLGKRVSLQSSIAMIRKMGKFLMDPAAIAVALGITVGELATLITAHSSKKGRHMNAANGKALRRAARRIKAFHRMCGTIDLLKSRGGSRSRVRTVTVCGTCRKSPCRC